MSQNGTPSHDDLRWYFQFQSDVLTQIPRPGEIDRSAALIWHNNRVLLKGKLFAALSHPPVAGFVSEDFQVKIGGRSLKNLITAGEYERIDSRINKRNIRMHGSAPTTVVIRLLGFARRVDTDFVLAEAKRQGLERPVPEHALCFGEQFPGIQRNHIVIFFHKPLHEPSDDCERVIALGTEGAFGRSVFLKSFKNTFEYDPLEMSMNCRFGFVVPEGGSHEQRK